MIGFIRYSYYFLAIIAGLFCVIPICLLRPYNAENAGVYFRILNILCYPIRFKVECEGLEIAHNNRPAIIIGNHQHNYELISLAPLFGLGSIVALGKAELAKIPLFGQIYLLTGNVYVKRGNKKKVMASLKTLEKRIKERRISPLIFPEGHRNPGEKLLPFKKGAYYTAIKTQIPLICFSCSQYVIHNDFNSLRPVRVFLKVHPPISTEGMDEKNISELVSKTRTIIEEGIIELNKKYL